MYKIALKDDSAQLSKFDFDIKRNKIYFAPLF